MGIFYRTFAEQITELWQKAHRLDKPLHPRLSWTCGIVNGRGDFHDLQAHGIALAASIIIQSRYVPRIFIGWDTPLGFTTLDRGGTKLRRSQYPMFMLRHFRGFRPRMLDRATPYACYDMQTRYVSLHRSDLSVNPWPFSLGLGYRAKYLGMRYVLTPHAIVSDIDTICTAPCVQYFDEQIAIDPTTFCITNWYDAEHVSVGLCIYSTPKYCNIFQPLLARVHWQTERRDSEFIQFVRKKFPEYRHALDLRLMNKNRINTERFYRSSVRKNYWTQDTAHYHAWKGEYKKGGGDFLKYYAEILDILRRSAEKQRRHQRRQRRRVPATS